MNKKISVAMAVYQGERYLSVQMDSILAQLGEEDELIISYDESKDHTWKLLEDYRRRDSRVKIYKNPVPGVTGNFNHAIRRCTGDYIYLSDQDDKWTENKVAVVQDYFEKTHADLIIHNGIHTNQELQPIGIPFFEMYRLGNGVIRNYVKPRMSGCCMAFTGRMKEIICPIPEIRGYDQWIAMICELTGKVVYPEEILIYHRLHDENVTPNKRRPLPIILRMRMRLAFFLFLRCIRTVLRRNK